MKAATGSEPAPKAESRKQRLARIRRAIAEGTYSVDGLDVSKAIVQKSIVRKSVVQKDAAKKSGAPKPADR